MTLDWKVTAGGILVMTLVLMASVKVGMMLSGNDARREAHEKDMIRSCSIATYSYTYSFQHVCREYGIELPMKEDL